MSWEEHQDQAFESALGHGVPLRESIQLAFEHPKRIERLIADTPKPSLWQVINESAVRVRPIFRWFDLYIGVYIDTKSPAIYVFPLPMIGLKIDWPGSAP